MNLAAMRDVVTSKFARQVLITQKHSPKILFVAGVVGVVSTTVLACRATLKVSDILEEHEKHVGFISEEAGTEQISHEEANKQIGKVKVKTAVTIAKGYLPAVGLGIVSIAALTGSQVILTRRNGALMAGYAALDKAYREYRQRVATEFGDEVDRKFAFGAEDVDIEEKTAEGNTIVSKGSEINGRFGGSPYAVIFDEQSKFFTKMPGGNRDFLMMRMNWANERLRAKGHLFLNEVYDMLDLPRTKAGQVVGWVYDKDKQVGDDYVSFGVFDGDPEFVDAFLDGHEKYVVLDFNVAGPIYDLI